MINSILLYTGSAIIFGWGIAHLIPTKAVISGLGQITEDNRRLLFMGWIAEGLTLCFIGILVFLITLLGKPEIAAAKIVYRASYIMLALLAALTSNTVARTNILPMKICPFVKMTAAVLFLLGTVL